MFTTLSAFHLLVDVATLLTTAMQRHTSKFVQNLSLFLVFFSTWTLARGDDLPCTEHHVTIPRHCHSGRLLLSLEYVGQTFQISTTSPDSRHFAVLANGDVICAAVSGVPVSGNVSFGVECRLGLLAWTEIVHVTVVDNQDLLLSFIQSYFEGHVVENAPPNSAVNGLQNISVSITNFQGRLLADVDKHAVDKNVRLNIDELRSQKTINVKFSISSGPEHMFSLADNGDGSVALRTLVELDYERQSQYLLSIVAVVPGLIATASARVRVYVDNINDNAPTLDRKEYIFQFDDVTRSEEEVKGMRITAFDPDNDQLTFSIDHEEDEFFIDPLSGEICFRHPAVVRRSYEFRVYADDGLHRSDPGLFRVQMNSKDQVQDDVGLTRGRRDVRPLRLVEIPENMIGDVVDGSEQSCAVKDS